jgi:hypothetical protein
MPVIFNPRTIFFVQTGPRLPVIRDEPRLGSCGMTEEEVEIVAQEMAKIGGTTWYPGRTSGTVLRVVNERYKDRARVAIATLERLRAGKEALNDTSAPQGSTPSADPSLTVGTIVVFRPSGERRAVTCRIEKIEEGRAYLVPCPKPDIGWTSLDNLQPLSIHVSLK